MKTLIELFDKSQIKNVAATLKYKPEKVIFAGFKSVMTKKRTGDIQRFFAARGEKMALQFEIISDYNFDSIAAKFRKFADTHEDVWFDLAGGNEIVIAAAGAVAVQKNIPIIRMDIKSGETVRVKNCEDLSEAAVPEISIDECIMLNGGTVTNEAEDDFKWEFNDEFVNDIGLMWSICRKNCAAWNRQSRIFAAAEIFGTTKGLEVSVDLKKLEEAGYDAVTDCRIIKKLVSSGIITDYRTKHGILTFCYKNYQVRRCIAKAGNILELHTYVTATKMEEVSDAAVGVCADWDGILHGRDNAYRDTKNEIDVVLMKKIMPVFISCKSGEIKKEALYELDTVAEKLGGENVKKVLVATHICSDPDSRRYFLQRARDMRIRVIEDVDMLTATEFKKKLHDI